MPLQTRKRIVAMFVLLTLSGMSSDAGEIRLRPQCAVEGSVVHLDAAADLSGCSADEVARFGKLPLCPAPREGEEKLMTALLVRETMRLYGLETPGLRIEGESRITRRAASTTSQPVVAQVSAKSEQLQDKPVEVPASSNAAAKIEEAILDYLISRDGGRSQWTVKLAVAKDRLPALETLVDPVASGGQNPFFGRQVFAMRDSADLHSAPIYVKADVTRVAKAVVARRAIGTGEIISADDVKLDSVNPLALPINAVLKLDDVVGREAVRLIPAGQPVQSTALRRPAVISRNELVTVYSVAAGLKVKASAKALHDAALGDVITLQPLDSDKKKIQARVTAPREAMVFVDSPRVAADAASTLPAVAHR